MEIMGKCFSFQSAVMIFWVFLFITIKFCCANSASSSATPAFPENEEGKPENWNWGNAGSVDHIEEEKFKSIKKLFNKKHLQPKPVILKKPFIKVPPRILDIQRLSAKSSVPISEEKRLRLVKRPGFLIISFFRNLSPIWNKPIPCVRNSKFLPFTKFRRPILRPIPIVHKPIPEYEKPILEPIPTVGKPIPEFERPISEPIPAVMKPIPKHEKPISEPIPNDKPSPKLTPLVRKPISNNDKPLPISNKHLLIPQLAPTMEPESLKLKEYLFKKLIPKLFPPKFKKPLPAQKTIPPP